MHKKRKITNSKSLHEFEKKLDTNLEKIYSNQNGSSSNFSILEKRKPHWVKKILIGQFIVLVFLFLFFGVMIFLRAGKVENNSSISVTVEMPEEISSGKDAEFVISYKNIEDFTLYDAELTITYPNNFEFRGSDPAASNQYNDIWRLGDLVRGGEGFLVLKGKVVGEVGSLVTIRGSVAYRPENFSSQFRNVFQSPTAQITSSILTIRADGPVQVIPEQKVTYSIQYKNTSDANLANVKIEAQYAGGFVFHSANPSPAPILVPEEETIENTTVTGNNVWTVENLTAGAEGVITIEGQYQNIETKESPFIAHIGVVDDASVYQIYQRHKLDIEIIGNGLSMDIVVNNSKEDVSVNFGDTLNYVVVFKNLGRKTLYDVTLQGIMESEVLDWETLIDKNFGTRQGTILVWDKNAVPQLAILNPLDEGSIAFSVRIKNEAQVDIEKTKLDTAFRMEGIIQRIGDLDANVKIITKTLVCDINTDVELRVQGRYFNDDNIAVGQGPLPPQVGKKTTFRIYWNLSNNLHEVSDVTVATRLSPDVVWEDKFSSTLGQLVYDRENSSVRWKIPKIPPKRTFEELEAWFDVSATPAENMTGKLILLTSETSLSAKDNVTQSGVSQLSLGITSNLEDDPFGGGRGLVVGGEE